MKRKRTVHQVIGTDVRLMRQYRGLTQKQLAKKIGSDHTAISRLEHGRQNFTLATLTKIATALNCIIRVSLDP